MIYLPAGADVSKFTIDGSSGTIALNSKTDVDPGRDSIVYKPVLVGEYTSHTVWVLTCPYVLTIYLVRILWCSFSFLAFCHASE